MSTNPVLVPVSVVSQFLANEKIASRHWLQCQMECLLDQVFDQLSTKFEDYLASNAITDTAHHTTIHSDHIQHQLRHEPSFQAHSHLQFQANTDHFISSELPVSNFAFEQSKNVVGYRGVDQVNPDEIASSMSHQATYHEHTKYPPSLSAPTSNPELSNKNEFENEFEYGFDVRDNDDQLQDDDDTARVDSDNPEDITEFDNTNNQLIPTDQISQNNASLSASCSNEQSNHNLTNRDDEDEDDCDCDDCRNGIEVEEEDGDDDDDDDVQIIEDDDEPSRPAKIPKIDTIESNNRQSLFPRQSSILNQTDQSNNEQTEPTEKADEDNVQTIEDDEVEHYLPKKNPRIDMTQKQSLVTRQSSRLVSSNQTEQVQYNIEPNGEADETNEVNNKDKLFITIRRQCHHIGCTQMFNNKTELNHHMSTQHDIFLHRCVVKDCNQSFSTKNNLSGHLKQVHLSTTQWHCDKCAKHFATYKQLSNHNMRYHQLGQYKCAYPDCSFTGGHKQQVYGHYINLHQVEITCDYPDCGRQFKQAHDLKRHQQAHLGIKPYRCKWPSCGFSATKCGNTITHIKRMHLTQNSQTNEQPPVDPKEYLEDEHLREGNDEMNKHNEERSLPQHLNNLNCSTET